MRRHFPIHFALSVFFVFATACDESGDGSDGGDGGGNSTSDVPEAWLGEEPHTHLAGTVAEQEIELIAEGSEAAGVGTVYCERNYIVPDLEDTSTFEDGYLQKVEIKFNFFHLDALAEFQMELEKDDLFAAVGETLAVGEDAEVALGINVDEDGPKAQEFEDEATGGTVKLELLTGEPDESGVIVPSGEGRYGAYVDIQLDSGGTLQGSFTVNCGENDLETPEE